MNNNFDQKTGPDQGTGPWLLVGVILLGWSLFALGYSWPGWLRSIPSALLMLSPVVFTLLGLAAWRRRQQWLPGILRTLDRHTEAVDSMPESRLGVWVAGAAGLGLFAELMIIRMHGSYFQVFSYFKNVSLLSCFLGLGVGYIVGTRRPLTTPLAILGLTVQIVMIHAMRLTGAAQELQNPVTEELSFGIAAGEGRHLVTVYGLFILLFAFNSLTFVPFGQLAGRLMSRMPKLSAYSWNLLGSLGGILAFNLMSLLWMPPAVWIVVVVAGTLLFMRSPASMVVGTAIVGMIAVGTVTISRNPNQRDIYSPYQMLTLDVHRAGPPTVRVSHVYYQRILNLDSASVANDPLMNLWENHYSLPYHVKPNPAKVLIVGAGTGNDVAAAVRGGAQYVDAVEIDPAILRLGQLLHPESPYQAEGVKAVNADARAFIRHAQEKYSLIVYGLLDSHTLLSGRAGVRLDSYVYTVEAFREARSKLADGGIICLTFSVITDRLGSKLYEMLSTAFDGTEPLVVQTRYDGGYAFLISENVQDIELPNLPGLEIVTSKFSGNEHEVTLSTDDWPFLYMPVKKYPSSYGLLILVLLGVSLVFLSEFNPGARSLSAPCFFLGAGFMLVETKSITELALVYGSTWFVIGIAIAGILVMAFLANLIVLRWGAPPPTVVYSLLALSLGGGLVLRSEQLSQLPPWLGGGLLTAALTLPLFFSGFAFSTELKKATSIGTALFSNLLGAMLGGFLEYNAMYFGFRSLYLMAFGMYAMAYFTSMRKPTAVDSPIAASVAAAAGN